MILSRCETSRLDQVFDAVQPSHLTDAIVPSPDARLSNLFGMIPRCGTEPPTENQAGWA